MIQNVEVSLHPCVLKKQVLLPPGKPPMQGTTLCFPPPSQHPPPQGGMLHGVQIAHQSSIPPRTNRFLLFPLLKVQYL